MQVHLLKLIFVIKVHAFRAWYMDTMQSAADSMQALFPCNHTGYDNNKGQYWHLFTTTIFFRPSQFELRYTSFLMSKKH